MALLGLFSKRDKYKSPGSSSSAPKSSGGSVADSNEGYLEVNPSHSPALLHNVYGNPEASSSKFHLGFHRKRANAAPEVTDSNNLLRPPTHMPTSKSEADADEIGPPPTKASLFAAYGDPQNALSTRSLPADARSPAKHMASTDLAPRRSSDGLRTVADVPPVPKKPGGLFSWAHRERKKSKAEESASELSPDVSSDTSFNLRSFRHIRPESPSADSTLSSPLLMPPVRPRPRNGSAASDTSQRISVAAFREMAARRSAAGSPTQSHVLLRPPSRSDSLEHATVRPSASSFQRSPGTAVRGSSVAISSGSTSSESEDSRESESDDDSTKRPRRQRTITQKVAAGKATSELGHGLRVPEHPPVRSAQSALGHSEGPSDGAQSPQSAKVGSSSGFFRTRASVSTSAMQPNAAAKQATLIASSKPVPNVSDRAKGKARARDSDSDDSSNSSSEDSDDAPLASLVRPPRPGSSASNTTSASRSRIPPKPLIDITQLSTPPLPPLPAPGDQPPSPKKEKEKLPTPPEKDRRSQNLEKFEHEMSSGRSVHLEKPSVNERLARIAQTAAGKSVEKLADAGPLERRSLDSQPLLAEEFPPRGRLPHPIRSQTAPLDSLDSLDSPSSSPPGRPHPKPRTFSSSSPNPAAAYDLTDPTPIVPTPIRQRSPPPAFSVTSRPPSQLSLNAHRLSLSQPTVKLVESSSASSSPTSPNTPWSSSPDSPPVTTAHLQQQAQHQMQPPPGHFSSTTPSVNPSPRAPSVQPSPRAPSVQPSPRAPSVQPSPRAPSVQPSPRAPSVQPSTRASSAQPSSRAPSVQPPPRSVLVHLKDAPSSSSSSSSPAPGSTSTVTPPHKSSPGPRQRSSTLIPNGGMPSSEGFTGSGLLASITTNPSANKNSTEKVSTLRATRPRSSTLLPQMEIAAAPIPRKPVDRESIYTTSSGGSGAPKPPSSSSSVSVPQGQTQSQSKAQAHRFPQRSRLPFNHDATSVGSHARSAPSPSNAPPPKPFANSERGNSPASSTGDSSSGRTPLTPADGSDYSYPDAKSVVSAMAGTRKGHRARPSVSFEDEPDKDRGRPSAKVGESEEERRRERRRGEAKAAIELGNVVNGRISLEDEDEDEIGPLNNMGPRMNMVNPMMSFTPASPVMGWQTPSNPAMMASQPFMMQPNDPRFLAAHQHAMLVAKQAYQMAVAQQALAAANEEWERGSSASAMSSVGLGMSGMNPMGGMNMGGMGMGMGMGGMPMGGMLPGGYGMQWTNPGSMMFPSSASMYAGSVIGSELGAGAGWGTQSEYGGPSRGNRTAAMFGARPTPAMNSARSEIGGPTSSGPRMAGQRPRTKTSPSDAPLPPQHARARQPPPPSSWRGGRPG